MTRRISIIKLINSRCVLEVKLVAMRKVVMSIARKEPINYHLDLEDKLTK